MFRIWFSLWVLFAVVLGGVEGLGFNWGTVSTHKLPPKVVVQMLKDNGVNKVKLFDADPTILNGLAGSGIEVMIAIQNDQLEAMTNYDNAKAYVKANVTRYHVTGGVNITYVAVGNEPFLRFYKDRFVNSTLPALKNVQKALNDAGLGDAVKATVPLNGDVYESPPWRPVPSTGRFRPDVRPAVASIAKFLNRSNAPFTVNIYPFLSLYDSHGAFPLDYAFFEGASQPLVDGNISYTNVFDANFDTLVWALKGEGYDDMPIVVGEMGWPTDGDQNANFYYAKKFYDGLLKKLASKEGTPMRSGEIEVYLFGLLDEDAKSTLPGNFERHWGVFAFDGQPKFPLDLFGNKKTLVGAKNVRYLPEKWCVLKSDAKNKTKIQENTDYACSHGADCTSLSDGSSCADIDNNAKASYAFNNYFQNQNQVNGSCDFEGLAMVTTKNASQGNCTFAIQVISSTSTLSPSPSPAPSHSLPPSSSQSSTSTSSKSSSHSVRPSLVVSLCVMVLLVVLVSS